jgi:hypothetical protein
VLDVLPDLYHRSPRMRGELLLTVLTLCVRLYKLHKEGLLDRRQVTQLLRDRELHFYALRVGLGPDEASTDQFHLVETLDLPQADRQQLSALPLAQHPRRTQVPTAEPAESQH